MNYTKCLILFFLCSLCEGKEIKVGVASENRLKVDAVKEAFQEIFPEDEIVMRSYPSQSGIPEQPIGRVAGLLGAANRLADLPADCDYAISIENFIEKQSLWVDVGAVFIREDDKVTILFTKSVIVPETFFNLTIQRGELTELGCSLTVGKVIHECYPHIDAGDWHREFGNVSRKTLIKETIVDHWRK